MSLSQRWTVQRLEIRDPYTSRSLLSKYGTNKLHYAFQHGASHELASASEYMSVVSGMSVRYPVFTFKNQCAGYKPQIRFQKTHLTCQASEENQSRLDDNVKAVAHRLLQKEEELKFITAPGRIPPRAAVVAALRKEIAALRLELAEPGSQGLDLSSLIIATPPSPASAAPAKTSTALAGKKLKGTSGARNALLMVEQKLADQSASSAGIPISEKVKEALDMIEQNMSTVGDASKNLNEFESLQVENAVLRTRLEVVLEKKRHLEKLHQALLKGHINPTNMSQKESRKKEIVYSF